MAESDAPAVGETPEQPRRRRRAASRPAGPPAAAPAALTSPPALPQLGHAEPDFVEAEVIIEQPAPSVVAEESLTPPRRRRRRASRPAGPPMEQPVDVTEQPQPEAAVASETVDTAETDSDAVEPSATEAETDVVEAEEPSVADDPVTEVEAAETVAVDEASTDDDAPSEDAEPAATEADDVESDHAEAADDDDALAIVDTDQDDDPVLASLAALEAQRGSAAKVGIAAALANPFKAPDVASALDALAAEISSDDADQDDDSATTADEDADSSDDESAESAPRRRRRRRGGRRRRRSADTAEETDESNVDDDAESDQSTDAEDQPQADDADQTTTEAPVEGTTRRRRRRRRRGEDTSVEAEDGVDVVVKVREPRKPKPDKDQITSIEGSTRMEAKRQRRREGRAAGRRRAPILSEAEFLARREAVDRIMLIRQADDYNQIAVLEDGVLVEHYVDRDSAASMIGNVYLGRVQNVLPSMEAAFVDIGRGRNAVLYAGEIDWEQFGVTGAERKVENVLKSGQAILVQVTKDPVGAKGARLTAHISLPGRYVVYSPGGHLSGISRKLPENERHRLKKILDEAVGEEASVIVRTAAEGATEEDLARDVNRLKAQWEVVEKKVKEGKAPQQLYSEPDLTVRIVRDLFTEDFSKLVVDGNGEGEDAYDSVQGYVTHVAPSLQERLVKWDRDADGDLFEKFRVNEQVAKALERKVHLPSGGSLIIDRTEAMTVIDVNTGKFTGTQGNLEATVTSNNLEAAEEIVRQLRLRDIGGIIVIDFIDMVLPANRELLLRRLVECLGRDRTRHQVAEVTSLGLVQMTRKRIGTGLAESFTVPCETCTGRGYHTHEAPVASQTPADGGDRDHRRGRGRNANVDKGNKS